MSANNVSLLKASTLTLAGYLGSATVAVVADATDVNTSVKESGIDVNAVKDSTGIEAVAITKGKISGVSLAGKISFDLVGNHTTGAFATSYDVTATLVAKTDLDPLVDAINTYLFN